MSQKQSTQSLNGNATSNRIAFAALVVAFLALLVTSWSFIPWNKNLRARAEAGNVKSQVKLADFCLDIGDYPESLYWYWISTSSRGDHLAKAYNNIGYILATNSDPENNDPEYYKNILKYFEKSAELGSKDALRNEYILLQTHIGATIPSKDYLFQLLEIREKMEADGSFDEDLELLSGGWEYITRTEDISSFEEEMDSTDSRYKFTFAGSAIGHDEDGLPHSVLYYNVYKQTGMRMVIPYVRIASEADDNAQQ
ncbi:MAG: hypothetical protein IKS55_04210 [Oscillospiraceae bacterium]|nr:hypothetical protein [Oscillospiraceae bacterium]